MEQQRDEGIALLTKAKQDEAQGDYQSAIDSMRKACDLLVLAGLWGDTERQTIEG